MYTSDFFFKKLYKKDLPILVLGFFFFKILFTDEREREREAQRHREREKQAPFREPDVGLNPSTPGSRPEPKGDGLNGLNR